MSEVERIYNELGSLGKLAEASNSPSDITAFEALAAKTLLLAAASYFERHICETVLTCARAAGTHALFITFIEKQGLERRYHAMFNWEASNINRFLSLFGPDNKATIAAAIDQDDDLGAAVGDFIYLNSQRNRLVHNNFASFNLDVSMQDIWNKFVSAKRLSDWLPSKLAEIAPALPGRGTGLGESLDQPGAP